MLPKNTWLCPLCTPRSQELCVNRWNWQQFRTTAWFLGCKGGKSVYGVLIPLQCSALNSGKFNAWLVIHFFILFLQVQPISLGWLSDWQGFSPPPLSNFGVHWRFRFSFVAQRDNKQLSFYAQMTCPLFCHSSCNETQENISGKFYFCKALSHRENIRENYFVCLWSEAVYRAQMTEKK